MQAGCSVKKYKVLQRGHNVFMQKGVQSFFQPKSVKDLNKCLKSCALETFCHICTLDNGICHIFHSMKDKLRVEITDIPSSATTYYETGQDEEWLKVYFVKSKSGFRVAESFVGNGTYKSWGPAECTRTFCADFFRSNLIDVWSNLPIHKVKMLARKNNEDVVSVMFNGKNSNKESWFSVSGALESPWKDLKIGRPFLKYKACSSFELCKEGETCWFTINNDKLYCESNSNDIPPYIVYSNKTHYIKYDDGEYADDFAIFISFK